MVKGGGGLMIPKTELTSCKAGDFNLLEENIFNL
jgi:hypothetical protein